MAGTVFVSPPLIPGILEGGDGTVGNPFHSIAAGMAKAKANAGGTVLLRSGHYIESISLDGFNNPDQAMEVRPERAGEVVIDSMLPEFLVPRTRADHWFRVRPPKGPFNNEWVWGHQYPATSAGGRVVTGAFWGVPQHTRLVSYDRVEDLRSLNQLWPDNATGALAVNRVWRALPKVQGQPQEYTPENRPNRPKYRPWVYMGPGIWFNDTDRRIHIRLAPTSNEVEGGVDFDPTSLDPNDVRLALSREGDHAIFLTRSRNIVFKNLILRFGSPDTIRLNSCQNIEFDHCQVWSGSRALFLVSDHSANEDITLAHCRIDGGIPRWMFRSDRKDSYVFSRDRNPPADDRRTSGELQEDNLAYSTSGVQLSSSSPQCLRTVVHNCEITNAHDSYIFGDQMEFHHNWVHNLNDDGIAVTGRADTRNAKIYCNVMTQCLTALSFATNERLQPIYIYANLFDLRQATLGKRPTGEGLATSLRQGHFFKDGKDEGEIYLFHNTCLVFDPGAKGDDRTDLNNSGFSYYATIGTSNPRISYNNIFLAAFTPDVKLKPIALLPPDGFGPTDGNTYLRIPAQPLPPPAGTAPTPDFKFRVRREAPNGAIDRSFPDLAAYRTAFWPAHPDTEYEHAGELVDPVFRSFNTVTGKDSEGDDLRLRPISPAKDTAVDLPDDLAQMYIAAVGEDPKDRGCYPASGKPLRVGVGGRRTFP